MRVRDWVEAVSWFVPSWAQIVEERGRERKVKIGSQGLSRAERDILESQVQTRIVPMVMRWCSKDQGVPQMMHLRIQRERKGLRGEGLMTMLLMVVIRVI